MLDVQIISDGGQIEKFREWRDIKMGYKKGNKIGETTFVNSMRMLFSNIESGKMMYLAFSKKSFYLLIFTMAMSVIANIVLINLLVNAPVTVGKTDSLTYIVQFVLSTSAVVCGFWLFLKGINIVTDK